MATEQRIVELIIDASGVEAGARRAEMAYEHLGDRAAAATAKATASFERQHQIFSSRLPQSIDRVADAFDNLRAKGDPVVTTQLRLEREMTRSLDVINRAVLTGVATEEQATAELSRIRTRQVAELDSVRLAHDAVASAAKRQAAEYAQLAAAARQSQAAHLSQSAFNSQLGIVSPSSGDARASASVFEDQFREMEASARRMEEISMLRSQQTGANFAQDLNGRFGIGQQANSARASASAFEEAAREADQLAAKVASLRAEINPTQAAQDRLNAELEQYSMLAERAGLSAKELAQAQALARSRFDAANGNHDRAGANDNNGMNRRSNLTYQAFDIGQGLAGGMPLGMIAAQQGPQIAQLYAGQGGLKAAASDVATLASGALAAIGPIGIAFGVAGGAALAYYALTKRETKTTEEILKSHQESIRSVAALWGDAAEQRSKYGRVSTDNVALGLDNSISALTKRLREDVESGAVGSGISSAINLNREETGLNGRQFRESSIFKVLQLDFDTLHKATVAGRPDILGLIGRLEDIRRSSGNSGIRKMADDAIDALKPFRDLAEAVRDADMARRRLFDDRGTNGRLLSRGTTNTADAGNLSLFESRERVAQERSQAAFDAQLVAISARSPQQKADAARASASAQYNDDETATMRRTRIEQAGMLALVQAEKFLAEAREARARNLGKVITDQQQEILLLGKTAGETAALRREYELINQLKDDARQNGGIVDEGEITRIRQTATEVGKLTDQLASMRLQQDAAFEREQLYRSDREANVAAGLRSAGVEVNLASQDAAVLRSIEVLREQKDAWEEIRDVGRSAIDDLTEGMSNGFENGADIFKGIVKDINKELLTLTVANPLKNLYGDNLPTMESVGGLGGIFSALTGGKFPGADAASKAVASMSVTAASVVINGGALGGIAGANDNLLGKDPVGEVLSAANGAGRVGGALGFVGNYKSGVDARLTDILNTAAQQTAGFKVEAMSGYRAGDPRFHGKGLATDVQLTDLMTGRKLGNYQDAASFGSYEKFAQTARQVQMQKYPELADDFRWGGYFGGGKGKYGAVDTMHFDLGGKRAGMGGGSWDTGLNSAQRALWPDANSRGMENAAQAIDKITASSEIAATGLGSLGSGLNTFGDALSQFPKAPGKGGGGLFDMIGNFFRGAFVPDGAQAMFAANGGLGLYANGGISDGPAIFGEAGPEAAVPLPDGRRIPVEVRMPRIAVNSNMPRPIVNRSTHFHGLPPGYTAQVDEEEDDYGNEKVNVTFSRMAASEAKRPGSPLNRTLRGMGAQKRMVKR